MVPPRWNGSNRSGPWGVRRGAVERWLGIPFAPPPTYGCGTTGGASGPSGPLPETIPQFSDEGRLAGNGLLLEALCQDFRALIVRSDGKSEGGKVPPSGGIASVG